MKFNPFLTKGYISPSYFCDRITESAAIIEAIQNNRDIILYGRRKIGKSALVKHVFEKLNKKNFCIWIDLLPTLNFQDLVDGLATQVLLRFEEKTSVGAKLWQGIKTLRPNINYDSITGQPSVTFVNQSPEISKSTFTELIHLIGNINRKVVLALDEFQQIMQYPEENVESYLRTLIQSVPNLSIIYSGSDQSMIEHMFLNINQPFYQSGQMLKLGPIAETEYVKFIQDHFMAAKKSIKQEDILAYIRWCKHRTINIQIVSNRIFSRNTKKICSEDIQQVKFQILGELDDMHYTLRRIMTKHQWKVVKSIAKEGKVHEPYGKAFMKKYGFTNSSTIRRTIEKFRSSGVLFYGVDEQGDFFEIDDVFFQKWIIYTL